ncbi:uncharacterized protein M421DRAFT_120973 [Didymella exigua CBS 183.55]|uniref:Uncharacterized protein n=1 Tax=Didymella exigua CBS 183.55 TaxID=1150837 RepID=A0A6A5S127_9PLEO|nr:uncharacterized protein M421DRAFT_120973 [Didymella exigua CBS 183.55]KAF1934425.1 hypothetical protein M421DRAFT_120973 [Didymella exigua CBS 183.55]
MGLLGIPWVFGVAVAPLPFAHGTLGWVSFRAIYKVWLSFFVIVFIRVRAVLMRASGVDVCEQC